MATYTFNASSGNHGYIVSQSNANYSTARAGSGTKTATTTGGSHTAGQLNIPATTYWVYESFLEFDTSSLSGKTLSSATLKIYISTINVEDAFTLEAFIDDFSTSVTTAEWVAAASLGSLTKVATLSSASFSTSAYNSFTDVAFPANINTTGKTRIVLASSLTRLGTAPGSAKDQWASFDSPQGTNVPQLVVVTNENNGALSSTIAAITLSSAISIETFGITDKSIGEITIAATGQLTSAGTGIVDTTMDPITLSAAVSIETFAYLEIEMDPITLNTATLLPISGDLSQSIGEFTLASVVALDTTGTLSTSIGTITLATSTQNGISADLAATIGPVILTAAESAPPWPFVHSFPQSPLDGTWRPEIGDDTLRSEREIGARQYRQRNGGNYTAATFAIMLQTAAQRIELDRFYVNDCKHGMQPFTWEDPETGDIERWTWAGAPAYNHVAGDNYRVECALRKEAA